MSAIYDCSEPHRRYGRLVWTSQKIWGGACLRGFFFFFFFRGVFVDLENKHLNITRSRSRPFSFFETEDTLVVIRSMPFMSSRMWKAVPSLRSLYPWIMTRDICKFEPRRSRETVLQLPNLCKMDQVKASVDKGLLKVVVPTFVSPEQDVIVELD